MTAREDALRRADAFTALVADVSTAVAQLGIRPHSIGVHTYDPYGQTGWLVDVGIGDDVPAVDDVAALYRLPDDDGETGNYTRTGQAEAAGWQVTINVYTGRPDGPAAQAAS